jgi:hypothetical protein
MVGLGGTQQHRWVVVMAGVSVLVLSGGEHIRAQSQESAGQRTGYTALVSVPVGESSDPEGDSPASGPPPNLVVPASHQKIVRAMWEQSSTFRSQCQRIGRERSLTVHVHLLPQTRQADATTRLTPRPGSGTVADLYLAKLDRFAELLAHELEHIIEHVDGIDLSQLTRRVPQLVWITAAGGYETRRAIHSGQIVASEVALASK